MIKTRVWICLLVGCFWWAWPCCSGPRSRPGPPEIWSDGVLVQRVSLAQDQSFSVESPYGTNTITVQGGRIAVTQSDCPGGDCMQTGWQDGGRPIVCLPHRLVIQFTGTAGPDAISG